MIYPAGTSMRRAKSPKNTSKPAWVASSREGGWTCLKGRGGDLLETDDSQNKCYYCLMARWSDAASDLCYILVVS